MRENISSVGGWLVPARGTWSRKSASPRLSISVTGRPAWVSARVRHRPTGPAPTTITGFVLLAMVIAWVRLLVRLNRAGRFLDGAGPALVRHVEHDPVRVAELGFVERIRRFGAARQIGRARGLDLLLGGIEIVDPHSEVEQADLFLLLEI